LLFNNFIEIRLKIRLDPSTVAWEQLLRINIHGEVTMPFWHRNFCEYLGQASRPISTGKLKALQPVHIRPINHVIYMESLVRLSAEGKSYLRGGLALRCFQCLSFLDIATQLTHLAARLEHQRSIIPGPLVLGNAPFKFPTPAADRDRHGCYFSAQFLRILTCSFLNKRPQISL